jgi:hypothetical protein
MPGLAFDLGPAKPDQPTEPFEVDRPVHLAVLVHLRLRPLAVGEGKELSLRAAGEREIDPTEPAEVGADPVTIDVSDGLIGHRHVGPDFFIVVVDEEFDPPVPVGTKEGCPAMFGRDLRFE